MGTISSKGENMKRCVLLLLLGFAPLLAQVDLNNAGAEELASLNGIGEKKAAVNLLLCE